MARPIAPRGQGRTRVVNAALELFAEHGVSGTSLQMIADHLGVTKAAVYFQFKTKEDIVLAVLGPAFDTMRSIVDAGESAPSPADASDVALRRVVDLMIEHRQVFATLYRDPEVQRIVEAHAEFQSLTYRLGQLLVGPNADARRRVAMSVLGAGLAHVGLDPQLADVDDAALRDALVDLGRTLMGATEAASAT